MRNAEMTVRITYKRSSSVITYYNGRPDAIPKIWKLNISDDTMYAVHIACFIIPETNPL